MSLPARRSLIEVHQRGATVAVAAATVPPQDGGPTLVAGDPQPVAADAAALGAALTDLVARGAQPGGRRSAASANGVWCTAFGVDGLAELIDGLRTVVLTAGPEGATLDAVGEDGTPAAGGPVDPADLADPARLGTLVSSALRDAPAQRVPLPSG